MTDPIRARLESALAERYLIGRELGRGGMARVFLAQDLKHGRQVALKVLHPELAHALGTERFLREIRTTAQLNHPGIVTMHDSGEADGLLYYVMPYVQGETLRDLMTREPRMAVTDVIRTVTQLADALAYAHARGTIHRDIKPENVLLPSRRHACLADFGLAQALTGEASTQLTVTGFVVGSPAYMSPEQALGETRVDARGDVYSLGCVLYEMLVGAPPYNAATPQELVAKHISAPIPRAREQRSDVPGWLESVIAKALAKDPNDRFANAEEFAAALAAHSTVSFRRASGGFQLPGRIMPASVVVLAIAAATIIFWPRAGTGIRDWLPGGFKSAVDSATYVVFPFDGPANAPAGLNEQTLLHDALGRWSGITLVDLFQVDDAIARGGAARMTSATARTVSARLRAGRYVRGQAQQVGNETRVRATLFDIQGTVLSQASADIGPASKVDSVFGALADSLLLRISGSARPPAVNVGTRSVPAYKAFVGGYQALREWNLARADSLLVKATRFDPQYALAHLWLAQVRSWSSEQPAGWEVLASRAVAGRSQLTETEQHIAQASLHLARGEFPQACSEYQAIVQADPNDFAGWFGLGECRRRDYLVEPNAASPSDWAFRSSYHRALLAYKRAFEILPSAHRAFSEGSFNRLRLYFFTKTSTGRKGLSNGPQQIDFSAHPAWAGDTLAFVPYPIALFKRLDPAVTASSAEPAVTFTRALFRDLAALWLREFPESITALEAYAVALQLTGDPSAADTLARAAELAREPGPKARLQAAALMARLRIAFPDDLAGLTSIKSQAEDLLSQFDPVPAVSAEALAGIATLVGKPDLAAALSRHVAPRFARELQISPSLASDALALLAYAGSGAPVDSIRVLENRVSSAIRSEMTAAKAADVRGELLGRPASVVIPYYRSQILNAGHSADDYLLSAEEHFINRDYSAMQGILERVRLDRQSRRPSDVSLDAWYPEAWLFFAAGNHRASADWLDPTLGALRSIPPDALQDALSMGVFLRAAALRAVLAQRQGDAKNQQRYAVAVSILWDGADPSLRPVVNRMKTLAQR